MSAYQDALNHLSELLASKFGMDDLRGLLFSIGTSLDVISKPDSGIETRAIAIVEYFKQRDTLPELIAACNRERPNADWPTVPLPSQESSAPRPANISAPVPFFSPLITPDSPSTPGVETERTLKVVQAIDVLDDLRHDPQANAEIVLLKSVLQSASERIVEMNHYKKLHDDFQALELSYKDIVSHSNWLSQGMDVWDALTQHMAEAQGLMDSLCRTAQAAGLGGSESLWINPLLQARQSAQSAIDSQEPKWLSLTSNQINRALDRGPTRMNGLMVRAVRELLKLEVAAHMKTLHEALTSHSNNAAAAQLKTFSAGVTELEQLRTQLQAQVTDHDQWQEADVELNRVDEEVKLDAEKLAQGWFDVTLPMQKLMNGNSASWAKELMDIGINVQQALQIPDFKRARTKFNEYRTKASNRFHLVDDELLRVCKELEVIGIRLHEFLPRLGN